MDINVLIICITVAVCVVFVAATVAYVAERSHKRWETAIAFTAALVNNQLGNEVNGDE